MVLCEEAKGSGDRREDGIADHGGCQNKAHVRDA